VKTSFWSDHENGAFQKHMPHGSNISRGEDSKALAAARRTALDVAAMNMHHGTSLVSVPQPAASDAGVAEPAEPILAAAGGLESDPYYYRLAAEMQRLRVEYAGGAPPTYSSDSGLEAAPTEVEQAAFQPPVYRQDTKSTRLIGGFRWRLDEK
jgi:hypothetical protein